MNKLFEPIQIGSMTLKNRIVMAPMGTTTDTTNAFNMRDVKYYGERAKGGCGLVLTGAVVASTEFEPAPCQKLTNTKDVYMLHLWLNVFIFTARSSASSSHPALAA